MNVHPKRRREREKARERGERERERVSEREREKERERERERERKRERERRERESGGRERGEMVLIMTSQTVYQKVAAYNDDDDTPSLVVKDIGVLQL